MSQSAARKIDKSPDAYRSIGEASQELGLQPHVLRYWETKFSKFLKPLKRRDGRRMFRPEDMQALRAIQKLVHDRGLTLKGALKLLSEQGVDSVLSGRAILAPAETMDASGPLNVSESPARSLQDSVRQAFEPASGADPAEALGTADRLQTMLADLSEIKSKLDAARLRRSA